MAARKDNESSKRGRHASALYILISAIISGLVCYRLGKFEGCASPWLASIQASDVWEENEYGVDGSYGVGDDNDDNTDSSINYGRFKTSSNIDPNDRRSISRTNVPYKCGERSDGFESKRSNITVLFFL